MIPAQAHLAWRRARHGLLAAACLTFMCMGAAAAQAAPTQVQATQELTVLLTPHAAHRAPGAGSSEVKLLPATTPITGEPTTLPVLARSTASAGAGWLEVMLPGRPNGSTGWIEDQGTRELVTPWHISVDLSARRVIVYENAHRVRSFPAIVGKPATPTPTGEFFVEESLQMKPGEPGGPYALALSARSDVLHEFEGGPGQIAVHGRENLGGTLGTAASHGCVRLATASIDWLTARIGPGTPVTIYG
jgi:lipoprotein-anchoring transpeptidase ErfK/SrfK